MTKQAITASVPSAHVAAVHTVLVLSVGGSPDPIVTALHQHEPDHVVFICSDDIAAYDTLGSYRQVTDEGKPCADAHGKPGQRANIRVLARMESVPFEVVRVADLDDLPDCYVRAQAVLDDVRHRFPTARLVVDYTGGTKSMAAGLALAALDREDCTLTFVSGFRPDLVRVEPGTSRLRTSDPNPARARRGLNRARAMMAAFDYPAVAHLTEELCRLHLPPDMDQAVGLLLKLSRAFDAWDRFDHATALQLLQHHRRVLHRHVMFLEGVCSSRAVLDSDFSAYPAPPEGRGDGVEIVEDLVLNAERRAHNGRYDDAVGRLYRAVELLVQLHLQRSYGLDTRHLDPAALPETARHLVTINPHTGVGYTALGKSYELLSHFPDDPLHAVFAPREKALRNALKLRNQSLFAHGFSPVREEDYTDIARPITEFLELAVAAIAPERRYAPAVQFPADLLAPFEKVTTP